jgi:hypothetical protein
MVPTEAPAHCELNETGNGKRKSFPRAYLSTTTRRCTGEWRYRSTQP